MDTTDTADIALRRLRAAGCVFAEDELAVLRSATDSPAHLLELVDRRARGEPLEQVVGWAEFAGLRIRLRPGVFVPRRRSEHLVATAARHTAPAATVVDLCCGSGALGAALAARVPGIDLHAADVDPAAVACARDNLPGRAVYEGDLFDALPAELKGHIDVLLANVPYVPTEHIALLPAEAREHEPAVALDGGDDGLAVLRRVAAGAATWLRPGGVMVSEVTAAQQAPEAVTAAGLVTAAEYDEEYDTTVVVGRRPG